MRVETSISPHVSELRSVTSAGSPLIVPSENPVPNTVVIASGGIFSDTQVNRTDYAKYLEKFERSTGFSLELNRTIDKIRNFVREEYADGDIYSPEEGTMWEWVEGTGLFKPGYGKDVVVRGQSIKYDDTHMLVKQYLEGAKPELGTIHEHGWSGVETIFDFQLLVRDEGSWIYYPTLAESEEAADSERLIA
jgi:hypothetical protein